MIIIEPSFFDIRQIFTTILSLKQYIFFNQQLNKIKF